MTPRQPNILFVLADDLGWADLSVYGQTSYTTPRLDALAAQGARFTQAYANSAVCSATRIALMTGRYQYRLRAGLEEPLPGPGKGLGLPPEHPTLPSLLAGLGYETALIGKWHLGFPPLFGPLRSGYQFFLGNLGGALDYFTHQRNAGDAASHDLWMDEQRIDRQGYYTEVLADEACGFLRRRDTSRPFFLSLHFTAPHWPWTGPDDEAASRDLTDLRHHDGGSVAIYGNMVRSLDTAVGQVLDTLAASGQADNTLVIFTSDNGGERFSNTWPFTGQKTELLEGGLRVPTLLRWPARIAPQVNTQVTITMDWLPTLLAAAGLPHQPDVDHPFDGQNILPALDGSRPTWPRTRFWRYKAHGQRAMRQGDHKYLKIGDNEFLFDVHQDPRERANLRHRQPDLFMQLQSDWMRWNTGMLPIDEKVFSLAIAPSQQADRYRQTT